MLMTAIEEILGPTYGIMLYQEQVMQVAQRFAGFSLGKADILRRAMGKKMLLKCTDAGRTFVAGALKLGHSEPKPRRSLLLWRSLPAMGLTAAHAYAYSASGLSDGLFQGPLSRCFL